MIYEIFQAVAADLIARKFSVSVAYGPERATINVENYPDGVVVFERDTAPDVVTAAVGVKTNPRRYRTRTIGGVVTIYGRSNEDGAHTGEHEGVCEDLADAVIVSLIEWSYAAKAGPDVPIEAPHFLGPADRDEVEVWPGRVYEFRFRVPRGVFKRDGEFQARPTGSASSVANQTRVRRSGADPDADPEIGCDST